MEELPINGNPTINGSSVVAFTQSNPATAHAAPAAHPQAAAAATATIVAAERRSHQTQLQLQLLAPRLQLLTVSIGLSAIDLVASNRTEL
jgi:hypothetical protein